MNCLSFLYSISDLRYTNAYQVHINDTDSWQLWMLFGDMISEVGRWFIYIQANPIDLLWEATPTSAVLCAPRHKARNKILSCQEQLLLGGSFSYRALIGYFIVFHLKVISYYKGR
jgi:hypothetical protein